MIIEAKTIPAQDKKYRLKTLITANILLDIILFIGIMTDYSWSNDFINLIYPVSVGLLGFITWMILRTLNPSLSIRKWNPYFAFVSAINVLIIWPYFLLSFFLAFPGSQDPYYMIQSPDTSKAIEISDSMDGGTGSVNVYLHYRYFPFVKRTLFMDLYPYNYHILRWVDNDTLLMPDPSVKSSSNEHLIPIDIRVINWGLRCYNNVSCLEP